MDRIHGSDPCIDLRPRSMDPIRWSNPWLWAMNRMVSWPVSRSVGRLVGGMVDWLVWLVVIGGWRRQIILSYKITNNIIGVLRANSLVAPWPGVCIVYRTSQHDRCGAPLGPFGFVFVFRKNVFRFYFYWFGFFLISLFHFPNFVICFIQKIFFGTQGRLRGDAADGSQALAWLRMPRSDVQRPRPRHHPPEHSCWTAALLDLLLSSQSVHGLGTHVLLKHMVC